MDETNEANRDYRAEVLTEHVRKVIDAAPPLTAEQRDRIAAPLRTHQKILTTTTRVPGSDIG